MNRILHGRAAVAGRMPRAGLLVPVAVMTLTGNLALSPPAHAQMHYPSRPVTLVVPGAAGGPTDIAARTIADPLSRSLGQQVVVTNRPGANGGIGTEFVVRAERDGYTLLAHYSGPIIQVPVCPCCSETPASDCCAKCNTELLTKRLAPVAKLLSVPQVIVGRVQLPIRTLPELVSYAKRNPKKLTFASAGIGSLQHLTGAMLEQQTGIQLGHVPYNGIEPALTGLLGGHIDLTCATASSLFGYVRGGNLFPLAVTGKSRLASLPDVPTAAEAGFPKLETGPWVAIYAPAGTPGAIIDKLTAEIAKIVQTPDFKRRAEEQGTEVSYMPPDQLAAFTRDELARRVDVMKAGGIIPN